MAPKALSSPDRFDERSLVESARTDANAFAELYRRYVDRIYRYSYRRSGSQTIAEDVTSATFEKALRGLGAYRWREPGIGPWLFRIASNELVNVYRKDNRQALAVDSLVHHSAASMPSSHVGDFDVDGIDAHLLAALSEIRPRYQRALTLRFFADLTNEEAAIAMGVSKATMAVIVHRGAASLRKVLDGTRREEVLDHD